jgi:uncharacterized protein YjiS (DUF1127 family)
MGTIPTTPFQTTNAARRLFATAAATLAQWLRAYIAWRVEEAVIVQLKSMSDRELEDIGLSCSQIKAAVGGDLVFEQNRTSKMASF